MPKLIIVTKLEDKIKKIKEEIILTTKHIKDSNEVVHTEQARLANLEKLKKRMSENDPRLKNATPQIAKQKKMIDFSKDKILRLQSTLKESQAELEKSQAELESLKNEQQVKSDKKVLFDKIPSHISATQKEVRQTSQSIAETQQQQNYSRGFGGRQDDLAEYLRNHAFQERIREERSYQQRKEQSNCYAPFHALKNKIQDSYIANKIGRAKDKIKRKFKRQNNK